MSVYSQIEANKAKTVFIMAIFVVFVTAAAYFLSAALGYSGPIWLVAMIVSLAISFASYYFSDSLLLSLSGAKELKDEPGRDVFDAVNNLSIAAGIPRPKVYYIDDPAPNAFATGRNPQHASICVTKGLVQMMDKSEIEGVIAHELSHIKNFDTRLLAIVSVLVGGLALMADLFLRSLWYRGDQDRRERGGGILLVLGIVFALVAPLVATLIQLAVSRRREFLADASSALVTRYPEGLAKALEKLAAYTKPASFANNATAHLFIVNPFGRKSSDFLTSLFQTHPPIAERIKVLRSL